MDIGGRRGYRILATTNAGAWLLVICWAIIIVVLSVQPGTEELGGRRIRFDASSFGHAVFFGILGFLTSNAIIHYRPMRHWWWTVVLVSLFGIVDELIQTVVPNRSPSIVDLSADIVGGLAGAIAWTVLARWQSGTHMRRAIRLRRPRPPATVVQPKALEPPMLPTIDK